MTAQELFAKIRMTPEINDNSQVIYSEYQICEAVNTVLSIVFNTLSTSKFQSLIGTLKTFR